jgi:hypothetical protein
MINNRGSPIVRQIFPHSGMYFVTDSEKSNREPHDRAGVAVRREARRLAGQDLQAQPRSEHRHRGPLGHVPPEVSDVVHVREDTLRRRSDLDSLDHGDHG